MVCTRIEMWRMVKVDWGGGLLPLLTSMWPQASQVSAKAPLTAVAMRASMEVFIFEVGGFEAGKGLFRAVALAECLV